MEKKKLKLSVSGSSKRTFSSIEQAKSKSKNTVVIEKKSSKFVGKSQFSRQNNVFISMTTDGCLCIKAYSQACPRAKIG